MCPRGSGWAGMFRERAAPPRSVSGSAQRPVNAASKSGVPFTVVSLVKPTPGDGSGPCWGTRVGRTTRPGSGQRQPAGWDYAHQVFGAREPSRTLVFRLRRLKRVCNSSEPWDVRSNRHRSTGLEAGDIATRPAKVWGSARFFGPSGERNRPTRELSQSSCTNGLPTGVGNVL